MQRHALRLTLIAAACAAAPLAAQAEGASPWLPIPGQFSLGVIHTTQSADSAYIGSMEIPLSAITGGGASDYRRTTTSIRLGYGISDSLAVDATLGRGRVRVGAADNDSGSTDSVLGLSWRVLDEYERPGLPTVTLRGAAIFKGSYDGARLAAIGNDADGLELAALVGKDFGRVALWLEAGVQDRSNSVPNASFFELGARARLGQSFSAQLSWASKKYSGDLDIGGPGFSPARFQEVRAERELVKLGLNYGFAGNQGVGLDWAKVTGGRNTVKDDRIVSLKYTIAF